MEKGDFLMAVRFVVQITIALKGGHQPMLPLRHQGLFLGHV